MSEKKKIKLLILITTLQAGGAEKVLIDLLNSIDNSLYDITVISFLGGIHEKRLPAHINYIKIIKTKIRLFQRLMMKYYFSIISRRKTAKKIIRNNYDIEIAYLEGLPTQIIAAHQSTASKLAFIHTNPMKNPVFRNLYSSNEALKKDYNSFDNIVFVSEDAKKGFEEYGFSSNKEIVLHNVIDINNIKRLSEEKADTPFSTKGLKIISVGRLTEEKAFYRLINAACELEKENLDFEIFIIGDGLLRNELNALKDKLNVKSVKLLGYRDNPYPYYRCSDLYVCSSKVEGYSTAVAEAVILGLPVLTTDCSGMSEILHDGENGIITQNNTASFTDGLRRIITDSNLLNQIKTSAKEYSSSANSEESLEAYYNLFNRLV